MPRPQFSTPRRSSSARPVKRFTLQQANRSLPLVGRIVGDIVKAHAQAAELQAKLEKLTGVKEQATAQEALENSIDRLQELVDELTEIGVELKDYQTGLVDFVGRHQGRDVYLCWKLGEERIAYWHELQTGFAGRQPVSTLEESD